MSWSRVMRMSSLTILLLATTDIVSSTNAFAYPEFQSFVEKTSGRTVDCAMCHRNANGPAGKEKGQVGSLSKEEIAALESARLAFEPGSLKEDSPILNDFGNKIIRAMGRKSFLKYKSEPAKLAEALTGSGDIDQDGIPDSEEYKDGTDPLNKLHGDPAKLFIVNFTRFKYHLFLAATACFMLSWGLIHLIRGFALNSKARKSNL